MRAVMDAVTNPGAETIVILKAAQISATECLNNTVGYFIAEDPSTILVIQPTLELAEAWSRDRLAPMLRDTPALRGLVQDPRSRDSGNTVKHKEYSGGRLTVVGANSPTGLRARSIRVVLADEVDLYPPSVGTEGDPLTLAAARQRTFWMAYGPSSHSITRELEVAPETGPARTRSTQRKAIRQPPAGRRAGNRQSRYSNGK